MWYLDRLGTALWEVALWIFQVANWEYMGWLRVWAGWHLGMRGFELVLVLGIWDGRDSFFASIGNMELLIWCADMCRTAK